MEDLSNNDIKSKIFFKMLIKQNSIKNYLNNKMEIFATDHKNGGGLFP